MIEYAPEDHIARLAPRGVLLIAAEHDVACPAKESRILFERAGAPKDLVVLEGAKHYDVYRGELFTRSASLAADWFARHLVVGAQPAR